MSLALSAGQRSHRAWAETMHAEWTKLRTLASTGWLLAGAVALTVTDGACAAVPIPDRRRRGQQPALATAPGADRPDDRRLYIQATAGVHALPLTPWQGLGVLALWAAGALILGGLVLRFRDA